MAQVKTLIKQGNSCALIIDKPILDLLGIGLDTPLSITTNGKSLTITPLSEKKESPPKKRKKKKTFAPALKSILG